MGLSVIRNLIWGIAAALALGTVTEAQTITEEELKRVEERFDIASEHVAKGKVQARASSEDGDQTI